jgi:hypothetical protein
MGFEVVTAVTLNFTIYRDADALYSSKNLQKVRRSALYLSRYMNIEKVFSFAEKQMQFIKLKSV